MGIIYKITNQINQKKYIGKTIRDLNTRWNEHKQYAISGRYNTPLYNALRKYGIDNFTCEVIEEGIDDIQELNAKEQNYIKLYHSTSHDQGYNIALGGDGGITSFKLTEEKINAIINILADTDNLNSFQEIGKQFDVSGSTIREINEGITWVRPNIKYPIRHYDVVGLSLSRNQYANIIYDIQNTNASLTEIRNKYGISEGQITSINQGKYCYKDHPYYQGIYNGDFPIRKDSRSFNSLEFYIPIFYEVLFTTNSMAKIGQKYGVEGNTIQCITTGRRRKELTSNFKLPMRQYKEENQKIFLTLYPEYKGGV